MTIAVLLRSGVMGNYHAPFWRAVGGATLSLTLIFLNLDLIPNYGDEQAKKVKFSGYRETRGMYKIKNQKTRINADINASYNILRKVIPTVFDGGIEGVVVRPTRVTPGRVKNA